MAWPVPLRREQVVEVGVDILPVDVEVLTEAAGVFEPDGLQHGPGGTVARRARKLAIGALSRYPPTRTASPVTAVGGGTDTTPCKGSHQPFPVSHPACDMSEQATTWLGIQRRKRPLVRAGVLLGLGFGGFFDGIVFHQILQLHHMVSARTDPTVVGDLRLNVMADGLFHAGTYVLTVLGVTLLWRAWQRPSVPTSGRSLLGSVVLGWGLFNFVEGTVNHQLLGIHHVWPDGPGPVIAWDVGFLVWGLVFVAGGYLVVRRDDPSPPVAERID